MNIKVGQIERSYTVAFSSEEVNGAKAVLNVMTLPMASYPELHVLDPKDDGGSGIYEIEKVLGLESFTYYLPPHQYLNQLIHDIIRWALDGHPGLGSARLPARPAIGTFVTQLVDEPFIPVEASPLSGERLSTLAKEGSLLGFATITETYGLLHHDPVVVLVAPICVVVIGATVGVGEGLRDRMKHFVSTSSAVSRKSTEDDDEE
jgi:hypothetical protein